MVSLAPNGAWTDRLGDSEEPPTVFYIETTSQEHYREPGGNAGTSTIKQLKQSSDTQNEILASWPYNVLIHRSIASSCSKRQAHRAHSQRETKASDTRLSEESGCTKNNTCLLDTPHRTLRSYL